MVDTEPVRLTVAPWTDEQVQSLNDYQKSGAFHPFTGRNELAPEHEDDVLVATTDGWISELDPDYHQDWAWSWMADRSWESIVQWQRDLGLRSG